MNKNKLETSLHAQVSSSLSAQADAIDAKIAERLQQARIKAVAAEGSNSWSERLWQVVSDYSVFSAPVAQASIAMLIAVFSLSLLLLPQFQQGLSKVSEPEIHENNHRALSDMDVLMSNEDMEFLENLEIYEWLVAEYG